MILNNIVITNIKTLNVRILSDSLVRIRQEGGEIFDTVIDRKIYPDNSIFLNAVDKELNPTPNGLKRL
jgi:hypothetical protein